MDVIDLISSDEEDNNGSIKNKLKNKCLVVKRVRPQKQNVIKIPMQKITVENHQPKNNNVPTTYINAVKKNPAVQKPQQQQTPSKPLQQQKQAVVLNESPSKQPPMKQTTLVISPLKKKDGTIGGQLNLASSGVTITPIKTSRGNTTTPVHVNLCTPSPKANKTITAMPQLSPPNNVIIQLVQPIRPVQLIQANQPIKPVNTAISKPTKRVNPIKISDTVTRRASSVEKSSDSDMLSRDSTSALIDETSTNTNGTMPQSTEPAEPSSKRRRTDDDQKRPFTEDFVKMIRIFREIDPAKDMEKIISKLEKYFQRAHIEYIKSKSFKTLITDIIGKIEAKPANIYVEINVLMEELKTRRVIEFSSVTEETSDPKSNEINGKKTRQIEKLNKALKKLQAQIRLSEEADVDLNDEYNSKFLQTERYKKRAVEIYEKLCDITGESRDAKRLVKKPIRFHGTKFAEFNRKLEKFINETKSFPDMFDVLRIIDHCNKQFNYRLTTEQRKILAQDAFQQVGMTLQKRRRLDLYEMVTYFAGTEADPATADSNLKTKLEENQRHYRKRMDDVIQKFTMNHDDSDGNEGEKEVRTREKPAMKRERNESVVKMEQSISREASPLNIIDQVPSASVTPLIEDNEIIAPDLIDADMDMLHNSVTFIEGNDFTDIVQDDGTLIEESDVVQQLQQEFYPTISSVTSLNPRQYNDFMNFEQTTLDSSNTKIL